MPFTRMHRCSRSLVAVEKVQCNGKAYLVDRANGVVYDFEDGVNEVLDPKPVSTAPPAGHFHDADDNPESYQRPHVHFRLETGTNRATRFHCTAHEDLRLTGVHSSRRFGVCVHTEHDKYAIHARVAFKLHAMKFFARSPHQSE